jgi:NUMOD3 motif
MIFSRNCSKCKKEIFYSNERNLNLSKQKNTSCKKCQNKGRIPYNKGKTNEQLFGVEKSNIISEKIRKTHKNKKLSEEHKIKIGLGGTGKTMSEEAKKKISLAQKGRKVSELTKEKLRQYKDEKSSFFGKHHSEETKQKISKINKGPNSYMWGKHLTQQCKKRISDKNKGRIVSKETRQKMSLIFKGRKHSKEAKKKMSEAHKGKKFIMSNEARKNVRLAKIKWVVNNKNNGLPIAPTFNKNACEIIDKYGKENNLNFKHAMNGGEFFIKELGYWVDGYDEKNNVVIEVDESHHFEDNGNLREKDIRRQKEIEELLKCIFIRIKYDPTKI